MNTFFSSCTKWLVGPLLGACLSGPVVLAQAPAWQTVFTTASSNSQQLAVAASASDGYGNVYLAGSFDGTVQFGGTTLTSAGGIDAFVAKWNSAAGNFVWAQRAGGTDDDDDATGVAVSGTSVYVTGSFKSFAANFGSTTLSNAGAVESIHASDVFVTKLVDAGPSASFAWALRAGGVDADDAYGIAVNGTSVYVAGSFGNTIVGRTPTPSSFGNTQLAAAGFVDVFVAKVVDAGTVGRFGWAQRAGGTGDDAAFALAVSGPNVYLAGGFASPTADFGGATLVNSVGYFDVFVAKVVDTGTAGTFGWAQRAGGPGQLGNDFDIATALAVNGANVYVAGIFDGSAAFGGTTVASLGETDAFVAKVTDAGATGNFVWAQRAGSPDIDVAGSVAVRESNVYVTGGFGGPAGTTGDFGNITLNSNGERAAFVTKLTDAGPSSGFAWVQQANAANGAVATTVVLSGTQVYVSGLATLPASFGTQTVTSPTASPSEVFLSSLTDGTLTAATPQAVEVPNLTLYPNPARVVVAVEIPAMAGAQATLTLVDGLGRAVRTRAVRLLPAGTHADLALTGLAPGLYHLRVQAEGYSASRALVVE